MLLLFFAETFLFLKGTGFLFDRVHKYKLLRKHIIHSEKLFLIRIGCICNENVCAAIYFGTKTIWVKAVHTLFTTFKDRGVTVSVYFDTLS